MKPKVKIEKPILAQVKKEFKEQLKEIQYRLKNNLLYDIREIKIIDIIPVSESRVKDIHPQIKDIEEVKKHRRKNYEALNDHIKHRFKKPLDRLKIVQTTLESEEEFIKDRIRKRLREHKRIRQKDKAQVEIIEDDKIEKELIEQNFNEWKKGNDKAKKDWEERKEKLRKELDSRIEVIDKELKENYDEADYQILLRWKVRPKEGNIIEIDENQKERLEKDEIFLDSFSLYSLKRGHIFDSLICTIPMDIKVEEKEVIVSEKTNPEMSYTIPYNVTVGGFGWKDWQWKYIPYQTYLYRIRVRYSSAQQYADSLNPKPLEITIDFPMWFINYYPWYIGFPVCTLGDGGFIPGTIRPQTTGLEEMPTLPGLGQPFNIKITLDPHDDHFESLELDYDDGNVLKNAFEVSFGVEYIAGFEFKLNPPDVQVCRVDGSTGQNIVISIYPLVYTQNILSYEFTGVFHSGGSLRMLFNILPSELNKINETGKIKFEIPIHLYYIDYFIYLHTIHYLTRLARPPLHIISDKYRDSPLLHYLRYQGIPHPYYRSFIYQDPVRFSSDGEVFDDRPLEVNLIIENLSTQVDLEDINITIENIEPYLHPIDGDPTRPNTSVERIISGREHPHIRQFTWILESFLDDRDSITITPQFRIEYKYGPPVPSTFDKKCDIIDGPKIKVIRNVEILQVPEQ